MFFCNSQKKSFLRIYQSLFSLRLLSHVVAFTMILGLSTLWAFDYGHPEFRGLTPCSLLAPQKMPLINFESEGTINRNTIRILSLDGGGIRGIMETFFLEQIEKLTGKRISDIFHLIAGTSAGGIIAAGLTVPDDSEENLLQNKPKFTAEDLTNLFKDHANKIFHKNIYSLWGFLGPRYNSASWENLAVEKFQTATFNQSLIDTLIVSHDLHGNKPKFFKSWSQKETFYTKDVVLATSAAPTYFQPRIVTSVNTPNPKSYFLSDGGTCANNPTACALVEAKKLYPTIHKYEIVSLGTGQYSDPLCYDQMKNAGFVGWGMNMLNISIDGPSNLIHQEMQTLYPNSYFRWNPVIDKEHAAMDNIAPHNIDYLLQVADDMISNNQQAFHDLVKRLKKPKEDLIPIYQTKRNSLQYQDIS